jgi:hypothetical protein
VKVGTRQAVDKIGAIISVRIFHRMRKKLLNTKTKRLSKKYRSWKLSNKLNGKMPKLMLLEIMESAY